ncbi:MAG: hypothetical protein AAFN27_21295, partial [Pseudomonadota bacterium]
TPTEIQPRSGPIESHQKVKLNSEGSRRDFEESLSEEISSIEQALIIHNNKIKQKLIEANALLSIEQQGLISVKTYDIQNILRLLELIPSIKPDNPRKDHTASEIKDLLLERKDISFRLNELKNQSWRSFTYLSMGVMLQGLIVIFLYIGTFAAGRQFLRLNRRRRQAKQFPNEIGLRTSAQELLEGLRFQSTTTTSAEAQVSLGKLGGSLGQERSLEARELSLPGLTAAFGDFLGKVAQVYNGKVVICLDELDKIEEIDDLDGLLRAVKGVLGHKNTHFLLTVSEDALARYSTRRRMERGMLESSFEIIAFLDRVRSDQSRDILKSMGLLSGTDCDDSHRAGLFWISAAAIPREIKRSAVSLRQHGFNLSAASPKRIWRRLFREKLADLKLWGTRLQVPDELGFTFLRLIKDIEARFEHEALPSPDRMRSIADRCFAFEGELLERITGEDKDVGSEADTDRINAMIRASLELRLELLSLSIIEGQNTLDDDLEEAFLEFFDALPANVLFARDLIDRVAGCCNGEMSELPSLKVEPCSDPQAEPEEDGHPGTEPQLDSTHETVA